MSKFPIVRIGELAAPQKGSFKIGPFGSLLKKNELIASGIPVAGIENVLPNNFLPKYRKFITKEKYSQLEQFAIVPNDVLVTTMGTIGRAAVVPGDIGTAIMDSHLFRMRVDETKISPKYLCYALNGYDGFQKELIQKARGAIMQGLNTTILKECSLPLPSIPEQQRIVSLLDEAFASIAGAKANAERNLVNARELFESVLQSTFENAGKDWEEKKLEDLFSIKHGFAFKGEFFTNKGKYVLLTPGNFYEEGGYRDRGEKQKYYVGDFPKDYILKKGDILIAMTEQAAGLLGSPIIIPESNMFLHNQRLGLIIYKEENKIDTKFLFHLFNTRRMRHLIHQSASGVKVRHTSPSKVLEISAFIPPLAEQNAVVARLEALSAQTKRLEVIYQCKLEALEELKKSLLSKAFNGEL